MSRFDDNIKIGLDSSKSHVTAGQLVLGVAPLLGLIRYQPKYGLASCQGAT